MKAAVVALIGVVGVGLGLHEYRNRKEAETQLGEVLQHRDDLLRKLADAENHLEALEPNRATSSLSVRLSPPELSQRTTKSDGSALYDTWKGMDAKQQLAVRYSSFLQKLRLTPERLKQLETLMIERRQEARDAAIAAKEGDVPDSSSPEVRQIASAAVAPIDQQIQALLGDSGYSQLVEFERTLPKRAIADELQQALSSSATPLTDDEVNKLVEALARNIPVRQGLEISVNLYGPLFPVGYQRISDQDTIQAAGVLTAEKLRTLKFLQQLQPKLLGP